MTECLVDPIKVLSINRNSQQQRPLLGADLNRKVPKEFRSLHLPTIPACPLVITNIAIAGTPVLQCFPKSTLPAASSELCRAVLVSLDRLTAGDAKVVYRATMELAIKKPLNYQPGDSLSLLCANSSEDVNWVLQRTVLHPVSDADSLFTVEYVRPGKAPLKPFPSSPISARFLLTYFLELHVPVSRRILHILADCARDSDEAFRLMQLASDEGVPYFEKYVKQPSLSFLDLLSCFPSCRIPLTRLLEILPRLQPRSYTMINLENDVNNSGTPRVEFIFTRVEFDDPVEDSSLGLFRYHNRRFGVCTSWLERLWTQAASPRLVDLYLRRNLNAFTLSEDPGQPIIMVAAGTGIAPFISFLRHYKQNCIAPPLWLVYGCRSPETSLLLPDVLADALSDGILKTCCLCFSRFHLCPNTSALPSGISGALTKKSCLHSDCLYVQDCILPIGRTGRTLSEHQRLLGDWILKRNARIMVCGEAREMASAVAAAFVRLIAFATHPQIMVDFEPGCKDGRLSAGVEYVKHMRNQRRYVEDIWA